MTKGILKEGINVTRISRDIRTSGTWIEGLSSNYLRVVYWNSLSSYKHYLIVIRTHICLKLFFISRNRTTKENAILTCELRDSRQPS